MKQHGASRMDTEKIRWRNERDHAHAEVRKGNEKRDQNTLDAADFVRDVGKPISTLRLLVIIPVTNAHLNRGSISFWGGIFVQFTTRFQRFPSIVGFRFQLAESLFRVRLGAPRLICREDVNSHDSKRTHRIFGTLLALLSSFERHRLGVNSHERTQSHFEAEGLRWI
jgi:hypothetical protein